MVLSFSTSNFTTPWLYTFYILLEMNGENMVNNISQVNITEAMQKVITWAM